MLIKKSFTLVEMLIVVVIIGILAAALIPRLIGAQSNARDMARKKGMNDIIAGVAGYYNDNGTYPYSGGQYGGTSNTYATNCINNFSSGLDNYLSDIPNDPQKNHLNWGVRIAGIQYTNGENETDHNKGNFACIGKYNITFFANPEATKMAERGYALHANFENIKNNNFLLPWNNWDAQNRSANHWNFAFDHGIDKISELQTKTCEGKIVLDSSFVGTGDNCKTNDPKRIIFAQFMKE